MSSSDDSLPDWVAEHQSPWPKSQIPASDSSSPDDEKQDATVAVEEQQHEQRPQGPTHTDVIPSPSVKKAAAVTALVAAPDVPGQIPVLLPEKLSTIRCLLEVEDGTSTDLAGDAGAVGRFGLVKEDSHQRAQLDLKGEMYSMTVVPCASSLCVMNIRQTDARVEAVLSDFVQLRQEEEQVGAQDDDATYLFGDDDENYQEQSTAAATAAAADPTSGKKTTKASTKRKSKGKGAASSNHGVSKKSSQKKQVRGK